MTWLEEVFQLGFEYLRRSSCPAFQRLMAHRALPVEIAPNDKGIALGNSSFLPCATGADKGQRARRYRHENPLMFKLFRSKHCFVEMETPVWALKE
ncbi:MAG: hypothetical protein ABIJ49_17355 [Pseudomonadota bacterium]|nr:hypothetical protein [Gammaproteobacteria bacterium]